MASGLSEFKRREPPIDIKSRASYQDSKLALSPSEATSPNRSFVDRTFDFIKLNQSIQDMKRYGEFTQQLLREVSKPPPSYYDFNKKNQ